MEPALRLITAMALGVNAWAHLQVVNGPLTTDGGVTVAGLFVADAVAAVVAAALVLLLPGGRAWTIALLVAALSLVALLLSVVVRVPAVGPLPELYEPLWYPEKVVAAVAAGVAVVAAAAGLLGRVRREQP